MNIRVHPGAGQDVCEARCWLNSRQPGLGDRLVDAVTEATNLIEDDAFRHRTYWRDIRRYRIPRWEYAVLFRVHDDEVIIFAIAHLRRNPDYWKSRTAD